MLVAAKKGPLGRHLVGWDEKRRRRKHYDASRQRAMDVKRQHRERLSSDALEHWKLHGRRAKHAYMERIHQALKSEGFHEEFLQWKHPGHHFGMVKDLGDKQIHVRIYEDGVIDAEIEVHRRYVEHLWSKRPSAHREIQRIFAKFGIPTKLINEHYVPKVGALRTKYPRTRTPVSRVVGAATAIVGGVGIVAARLVLNRMKGRA